jgi:hypothetical protein
MVTWLGARRSIPIAIANLFICLSAGVMLWMMMDIATDPSYEAVPVGIDEWFQWALLTSPSVLALGVLPFSLWRFNHKILLVSAALSSISILFPFGILAGVLAWRDRKNEPRQGPKEAEVASHLGFRQGGMDLVKVAHLMETNGFKKVTLSSEFEGILFQIVGEGTIGLQKMPVLVRLVPVLDEQTAERVSEEFIQMHKKKQSYLFGHFFLYCLLAGKVEQKAAEWLIDTIRREKTQSVKTSLGAGGGHFIMADEEAGRGFIMQSNEMDFTSDRKMVEILCEAGILHVPNQPGESSLKSQGR